MFYTFRRVVWCVAGLGVYRESPGWVPRAYPNILKRARLAGYCVHCQAWCYTRRYTGTASLDKVSHASLDYGLGVARLPPGRVVRTLSS